MRTALPALIGATLTLAAAWALASVGLAAGQDDRAGHADLARELAGEASAGFAAERLDAWSRSAIERALQRAGTPVDVPAAVPEGTPVLPRERSAAGPERAATAEVLLFTSLALPAASWRAAGGEAARIGAPLVLRGLAEGSLPATARRIAARLGDAKAGVVIDPRLFRLFGVTRVPTVVVVPGGVPPCRSRGCADDDPLPFDRVTGNLSLAAALEAVASEGDAGRAAARRHLATLRGTER